MSAQPHLKFSGFYLELLLMHFMRAKFQMAT